MSVKGEEHHIQVGPQTLYANIWSPQTVICDLTLSEVTIPVILEDLCLVVVVLQLTSKQLTF